MKALVTKNALFFITIFLFQSFFTCAVFATNNPPDKAHSSLSPNTQEVLADGSTKATLIVILKDSSAHPLAGDNVSLVVDPSVSVDPSSQILDESGAATFNLTSTTAQTDQIAVNDITAGNIPFNDMGSVTFNQAPTAAPTTTPVPTCSPAITPHLTSAISSGSTQITLTWESTQGTVDHYSVSYGTKSQQYMYGNPNIGGLQATSYTVGYLSTGKTYYFAIQAVNRCYTSNYSNEVSAVAGSALTPSVGPTQAVQAAATQVSPTPIPTDTPQPTPTPSPTDTPAPTPEDVKGQTVASTLGTMKVFLIAIGCAIVLSTIGAGIFWWIGKRGKKESS